MYVYLLLDDSFSGLPDYLQKHTLSRVLNGEYENNPIEHLSLVTLSADELRKAQDEAGANAFTMTIRVNNGQINPLPGVAHIDAVGSVISGALYSFAAHLTGSTDTIEVGSTHEVYPLVMKLEEFREQNYLTEPDMEWQRLINPNTPVEVGAVKDDSHLESQEVVDEDTDSYHAQCLVHDSGE